MIKREMCNNVSTRLEDIAYLVKLIVNRTFPMKILDLFLTHRYLVDNLLVIDAS